MAKRKIDDWKVHEPIVQDFERHDIGDVLSSKEPISAKVNITKTTFVVTVDNESAGRLSRIARKKRMSLTELLQEWMREKIHEQSAAGF